MSIVMRLRHVLTLGLTAVILTLVSFIILLLASGYEFDRKSLSIQGTGIIAVNSVPDGALVYINDVPKDASNTTVTNLKPGTYTVRLEKEGFATWEKEITVKSQLVSKTEALLLPLFPTLEPLTFTGAESPKISPDGQKIVYALSQGQSAGLWLLNLEERPFNLNRSAQLLLANTESTQYTATDVVWGPDSNSFIYTLPQTEPTPTPQGVLTEEPVLEPPTKQTYLYDISAGTNTPVFDLAAQMKEWQGLEQLALEEKLNSLSSQVVAEINSLSVVSWSPDNKYILHTVESDDTIDYQIYMVPPTLSGNITPTPNPTITEGQNTTIFSAEKTATNFAITWFPDSSHLIISQEEGENSAMIEIIDRSGSNRTQLFRGIVKSLFVEPNPTGSKVIILTNFNPASEIYNLYSINLR